MGTRTISDEFIDDLKNGKLHFFLEKASEANRDISLEVRDGYINLYYRGGSILKISEKKKHEYKFHFDEYYAKRKNGRNVELHSHNWTEKDYEKNFVKLKKTMDGWFEENPKHEQNFRHHVSIQNNNVVDVEYAIADQRMRLDMIMIDEKGELYLVENKYGNGSISSYVSNSDKQKPGLAKHYGDFIDIVTKKEIWSALKDTVEEIIEVKRKLGLPCVKHKLKTDSKGKPVFNALFVLADFSLSSRSTLIDREKDAISKGYKDYLEQLSPKVLRVGANQYKINLGAAEDFMNFIL